MLAAKAAAPTKDGRLFARAQPMEGLVEMQSKLLSHQPHEPLHISENKGMVIWRNGANGNVT